MQRGFCVGNPKEADSSEDLGLDGRMVLKLILRIMWTGGIDKSSSG
jgi:hypothetical protein